MNINCSVLPTLQPVALWGVTCTGHGSSGRASDLRQLHSWLAVCLWCRFLQRAFLPVYRREMA
jgi:hypothetical protein